MMTVTKPLSFTSASAMVRPTRAIRSRALVVRASVEDSAPKESIPTPPASVPAAVEASAPAAPAPAPVAAPQGFGDLMAFAGPAPELINGRLAMLAVTAAIGAELSSGESVLRQFGDAPLLVLLTGGLFTIASLIPMFNGAKREAFAFFSPAAEMANGRAAMLGFASLLVVEAVRGAALF